jgi:hypothetical protein
MEHRGGGVLTMRPSLVAPSRPDRTFRGLAGDRAAMSEARAGFLGFTYQPVDIRHALAQNAEKFSFVEV